MTTAASRPVTLRSGDTTRDFDQDRVVVGRDVSCDVVLDDPGTSRHHLVVERHERGWVVVDSSSGGTWVQGRRVARHDVGPTPVELRLGSADGVAVSVWAPAVVAAPPPTPRAPVQAVQPGYPGQQVYPSPPRQQGYPGQPQHPGPPAQFAQPVVPPGQLTHGRSMLPAHAGAGRSLTIGRDLSNDIVLDDPLVSRFHGRLEIGMPSVVHDLGSFNGMFVNGLRVRESAWLEPGFELIVGNQTFRWDGVQLLSTATKHEFTLYADGLATIVKGGKVLLDHVSFQLEPSSLTAVIGPSGAGKSTLLGALTGLRPATHGRVVWQGHDLYAAYEQLRFQIGLVPQQDIQHPQLKVRQALGFAAELRLPPDTSAAERDVRVQTVAQQLQLTQRLDNRIGTELSGGQKKRVSIATELLTAPPLLFLDEPTSGLDPGLDLEVMRQLRGLADDGRVVVVVTHSVLALDVCDNVMVLAPGGRIAYFGPPDGVLAHFGAKTYPQVFDLLDDPDLWRRIPAPAPPTTSTPLPSGPFGAAAVPQPPRQSFGRQFTTLLRRNTAVVVADRLLLTMLLLLPLVLGGLSRLVPGHGGLSLDATGRDVTQPNGVVAFLVNSEEARQRLVVLIVAAALMGTAITIRELVGERSIFQREYAVGLSPEIYLVSKVAVLGSAAFLQGLLVTFIALVGLPGPDGTAGALRVALMIGLLTFTTAVIGLWLSSLVTSSEQTMPVLVGMIMVQLVLSGSLFPVAGRPLLEQIAWISPSRWAYAACAGAMDLNRQKSADDGDWIAGPGVGHALLDLLLLAVLCGIAFVLGRMAVRRSATAD